MAKAKTPTHKVVMTEGKREIIRNLLSEYDIQSAQDIQEALKDLLGGTIKELMEAEMEGHLGYEKSERSDKQLNYSILIMYNFLLIYVNFLKLLKIRCWLKYCALSF